MKGKPEFDESKLPGTNIEIENVHLLQFYFTFLNGSYDSKRERFWWLVEANRSFESPKNSGIRALQFLFYNVDKVQVHTENLHFSYGFEKDMAYPFATYFRDIEFDEKERLYLFIEGISYSNLKKIKSSKIIRID